MTPLEFDLQDSDVTQLAVQALTAAQRRARKSGRSVVLVENGELVRIGLHDKTVLKKLPPRKKVSVRTKRATT